MPFKPPSEQEIFNFVASTHNLDRVPLDGSQIINTWHQKGSYAKDPNPFAQGHFRAVMYVIHNLLLSNDFPSKTVELPTTRESHSALFWLRDLHHKVVDPLVGHKMLDGDPNAPSPVLVGNYRISQSMAVTKPCPPPDLIPKIMHNWLVEYANFNEKIKDKIDNPYAFTREESSEIVKKSYQVNLFFCTVQPLSYYNQRMGRLLENTFRLAWRLPMKFYTAQSNDTVKLPADIIAYEENLPHLVNAALTVRG